MKKLRVSWAVIATIILALAWLWMDWYSGSIPKVKPLELFEGLTIRNLFQNRWIDIAFIPLWVLLWDVYKGESVQKDEYYNGLMAAVPLGMLIGVLYGLGEPLVFSVSICCVLAVTAGIITGFRLVKESTFISGACFTIGICLVFGFIISLLSGFGNGLIVAFLVWVATLIPYSVFYLASSLLKYLTSQARQRA